jgi:glyoxylase-like metal-dependent hydrolase (beta-lactamase superfamily II)
LIPRDIEFYRPSIISIEIRSSEYHYILDDYEIVMLHTPGHTPGSISVYVDTTRGKIIFCGGLLDVFKEHDKGNLKRYRKDIEKSIYKIHELSPDILCSSTEQCIFGKSNIEKNLSDMLDYLDLS